MRLNNDKYFTSSLLDSPEILHGFGTRSFDPDRFTSKNCLRVPQTKQIHSASVIIIDNNVSSSSGSDRRIHVQPIEADGWMTKVPSICLVIRTADCLPLLIFDKKLKYAAAIHAGWRGTSKHIVENAIQSLTSLGSRTEDINAVIGPHICKDCYEVGEDVLDDFEENGWNFEAISTKKASKKYLLDLKAAVKSELSRFGVTNIDASSHCTKCSNDLFYSYRAGDTEGRNISFIAILVSQASFQPQ